MFTLDELKGLLNLCKIAETHKKVCEDIGMPLGVDVLRDFYGLAFRVVEEIKTAEKAAAETEKKA